MWHYNRLSHVRFLLYVKNAADQKTIMSNQVFSLVKNVSERFTILSHNQFGDDNYARGVRCTVLPISNDSISHPQKNGVARVVV